MVGIFSGKMKREQLVNKRNAKRDAFAGDGWNNQNGRKPGVGSAKLITTTLGADKEGVRSMFVSEGDDAVEKRRKEAYAQLKYRFFEKLDKVAAKAHVTGSVPVAHWLHPEIKPQSEGATGGRKRIPLPIQLPTPDWTPPVGEVKDSEDDEDVDDEDDEEDSEVDEEQKAAEAAKKAANAKKIIIIKRDEDEEEDQGPVEDVVINYRTVALAEKASFAKWENHMSILSAQVRDRDGTNQYEVNLDVWRQLWRTVSLSNVVLLLCDVRFPMLQLPLTVIRYIMLDCRRPLVIVLNKVDVVPKDVVEAWKVFLKSHFTRLLDELLVEDDAKVAAGKVAAAEAATSGDEKAAAAAAKASVPSWDRTALPRDVDGNWLISVAEFTCVPVRNTGVLVTSAAQEAKKKGTNKTKGPTARRGKRNANQAMRRVMEVSKTASLSGYKIPGASDDDSSSSSDDDEDEDYEVQARYKTNNFKGSEKIRKEEAEEAKEKEHREDDYVVLQLRTIVGLCVELHSKNVAAASTGAGSTPEDSAITIGMCGQPNVGKSSLMNCILGEKHVSVSASAGHTKHLQTITVDMPRLSTEEAAEDATSAPTPAKKMTIVDCPGIVWPMIGLPRPLQAIIGSHQIAQSRDPQSSIRYVAACVPIEGNNVYRLTRYDDSYVREGDNWSTFEICEAFAHKRGYHHSHGKLDIHRAAIEILSEVQEGRVPLYHTPPTSSTRPFTLAESITH